MNIKEMFKLQGFKNLLISNISNSQYKKQIGNYISVNVLIFIFKNIFQTLESNKDSI
jgi:site-specific DNA-cytosine methylase